MKASIFITAATFFIVASALPSTAQDKFGSWGEPVNLGPTINSKCANLSCETERPAISRDNLSLYFDSNRPGFGRHDIWVSHRASVDEPWGTPQNLGPTVNTAGDEFSPNLSPNGHWLFFGSNRSGGCGGLDIWASHRKDRDDDLAWEPPVNLGCILNTSGDDDFPFLFVDNEQDTTMLYFASNRSFGGYHIYASTMNEEDGTFGPGVLVPELNCFDPMCIRDSRVTIRRDGLEIIFGSFNRPGGFGLQDLWVSTRKDTEDPWSTPVNLGPTVNTKFQEGGPALSRDGANLYFHSSRPGSFGLLDLYVTTRTKLREHDEDEESGHRR
jgi:peptidoglycan-associated lipoprotein